MPSNDQTGRQQTDETPPDLMGRRIEKLESEYGNRYRLQAPPDNKLPKSGMPAEDALGLVSEDVLLDGIPMSRPFVTTWMGAEAERTVTTPVSVMRITNVARSAHPPSASPRLAPVRG